MPQLIFLVNFVDPETDLDGDFDRKQAKIASKASKKDLILHNTSKGLLILDPNM